MALHPIHAQIAAVETAAKDDPGNGALAHAALTLRAVSIACAPGNHADDWSWACGADLDVEAWPVDDRLTRAMEGLMP